VIAALRAALSKTIIMPSYEYKVTESVLKLTAWAVPDQTDANFEVTGEKGSGIFIGKKQNAANRSRVSERA
jgi:hypothetical protein